MTRPLEAACNSLRAELNTVHRRLLAHLEGRDLPLRLRDGPSKKVSSLKFKHVKVLKSFLVVNQCRGSDEVHFYCKCYYIRRFSI